MEKKIRWYNKAIILPLFSLTVAVAGIGYSVKMKNDLKERLTLNSKLEKLADTDCDGFLSTEENYLMHCAMGTENERLEYYPTIEDLEKGIAYFENQ